MNDSTLLPRVVSGTYLSGIFMKVMATATTATNIILID
jgi:hypothetical protein